MSCPRCHTALERKQYNNVISFCCPHCQGLAITVSALRSLGVDPENVYNIWKSANAGKLGSQLPCPECGNQMRIIKLDSGQNIFYIDACIRCQVIWFDFGEIENLPTVPLQLPRTYDQIATPISSLNYPVQNHSSHPPVPPTFLENLGIDGEWCGLALRLLIRLLLRI